jgi:hypothetical protein
VAAKILLELSDQLRVLQQRPWYNQFFQPLADLFKALKCLGLLRPGNLETCQEIPSPLTKVRRQRRGIGICFKVFQQLLSSSNGRERFLNPFQALTFPHLPFQVAVNRSLPLQCLAQCLVMPDPFLIGQLGLAYLFLTLFEGRDSLVYPGLLCQGFEQIVGFGLEFGLDFSEIGYSRSCGKEDLANVSTTLDDFLPTADQISMVNAEHRGKEVRVHTA